MSSFFSASRSSKSGLVMYSTPAAKQIAEDLGVVGWQCSEQAGRQFGLNAQLEALRFGCDLLLARKHRFSHPVELYLGRFAPGRYSCIRDRWHAKSARDNEPATTLLNDSGRVGANSPEPYYGEPGEVYSMSQVRASTKRANPAKRAGNLVRSDKRGVPVAISRGRAKALRGFVRRTLTRRRC